MLMKNDFFVQVLQYLVGIFNQELVTVSILDYTTLLLYAIVWFITDRFVVFVVFINLIFIGALLTSRSWAMRHYGTTQLCHPTWFVLIVILGD